MIPNFLFEISRQFIFAMRNIFKITAKVKTPHFILAQIFFFVYYSYLQFSPIFEKVQGLHSFTFIFTKDKKIIQNKKLFQKDDSKQNGKTQKNNLYQLMPLFFFIKNITNLGTKNFRKNPLYLWGVKESYTFKNHCVAKNGKRTSTTYKTYPDIKRKPCKMLFGCEMGSTIGLWLFCILYVGVEK